VGIIAAALLYLSKTVNLTLDDLHHRGRSVGGGMCSSLVAGVLADWFGRKKMMIVSGLMVSSATSASSLSLKGLCRCCSGRLLQEPAVA